MLSENYSVCLSDDGSPREIGRKGPVVTYKAIGYDSGRTVAMQLIPIASLSEGERVRFEESARATQKIDHPNIARVFDVGIKDEQLVFVSEYVEGETAEDWIDEHGPMPPDAVLRIGFQVASALAAGDEYGPMNHSIQPANLMIVPGVAADGGWPGIKLLNFGLPSVKLNSEAGETRELVPSISPQFASPERRQNTIVDVRSDIFSLGATMWFLLTGSALPLADSTEPGPRLSAKTADVPRFVRNLVSHMLRSDPEERPHDPAALAEKIRACLQKAERQTAFTRSFAPAAIPGTTKVEKRSVAPALALAAAILFLAALGAFFLPQRFLNPQPKPLGVLIGVPETSSQASISELAAMSVAVNERTNTPSVASPTDTEQSGSLAQQSVSPPAPPVNLPGGASSATPDMDKGSASTQLAVNDRMAEPPAPAEGPSTASPTSSTPEPPPAEKNESAPASGDHTATAANDSSTTTAAGDEPASSSEQVKKRDKSPGSKTKTKSRRQRVAKSSVARPLPPLRVGADSAIVVGTTRNGNWVLRLPSGERVIAPPVPNLEDAPIVTPRAVRRIPRPLPLEEEPPVVVVPPAF
jgi:serine/threonine protein kinase